MLQYSITVLFVFIGGLNQIVSADPCPRIVTLSPSSTEIVYALKLDKQVAAVSRFSSYPPEVNSKQKVGSLHDVSLESLIRLDADPVIILNEHTTLIEKLDTLDIPYIRIDHGSITGILESIKIIGTRCAAAGWKTLHRKLSDTLEHWQERFKSKPPVKTLIIIGEQTNAGGQQSFYISGADGYYAEALTAIGGINVQTGPTGMMPALSLEQMYRLNPDVIIEIAPERIPDSPSEILSTFATMFPKVPAVRNRRMHVLSASYTYTPGPRFPLLLENFAKLLHPDHTKGALLE